MKLVIYHRPYYIDYLILTDTGGEWDGVTRKFSDSQEAHQKCIDYLRDLIKQNKWEKKLKGKK